MRTVLFILIGLVFISTLVLGILIWRQTIKIEEKALAAKRRGEAYAPPFDSEDEEEDRDDKWY